MRQRYSSSSSRRVSHLSEAVRPRGAQRLIGQLQQLLRTLQGFGAGAQLILREKNKTRTERSTSVKCSRLFQYNEAAVLPAEAKEVEASFESHSRVLGLNIHFI